MQREYIYTRLKHHLLETMPGLEPDLISMDKRLDELGCNSVDRADIVTMTMEDLALEIDVRDFSSVRSIEDLVELFHGKTG